MALDNRWLEVAPRNFTQNGELNGSVYLADTRGFKIRQRVTLKATGFNNLEADVIRVYKDRIIVGSFEKQKPVDMTPYTLAVSPTVSAKEQEKKYITTEEIIKYVYEPEGINAIRVFNVDENGAAYNEQNPLFVQLSDGSISIGTVNAQIEVQLSRKDNDPEAGDVHDSVRVGNQQYEMTFTANDDESKAAADVVALNRLIDVPHDDVEITQFNADGDPETIEFREGGNLKMTLGLVYNADGDLQRVQRTKP